MKFIYLTKLTKTVLSGFKPNKLHHVYAKIYFSN
jgi:hypothetical protein